MKGEYAEGSRIGSPLAQRVLFSAFAALVVAVPVLSFAYRKFDALEWAKTVSNLGEVLAAVFGLSMTVVAIVVQLAAQRHSNLVVSRFVKDPLNISVLLFMVVSCIYVVLLPGFTTGDKGSGGLVLLGVGVTVVSFLLLIPWFFYVFRSVQADTLIKALAREAVRRFEVLVAASGASTGVVDAQVGSRESIHRIADVCVAAIQNADRDLATSSVSAVFDVLARYSAHKSEMPAIWFSPTAAVLEHTSAQLSSELERERTWFEADTFFELDHTVRRAADSMPELVALVASRAQSLALSAASRGDQYLVELSGHFFNTLIRHGINGGNVRILYAVFEHYRRMVADLVRRGTDRDEQGGLLPVDARQLTAASVRYFVYYGKLANQRGMGFVTATIAHDLRRLCVLAYEMDPELGGSILEAILELDEDPEGERSEQTLIGVRRAQSLLAAELRAVGQMDGVRQIAVDMRDESTERLRAVHEGLLGVESARFWELTDRGVNFEYVRPELRPHLSAFVDEVRQLIAGRGQSR